THGVNALGGSHPYPFVGLQSEFSDQSSQARKMGIGGRDIQAQERFPRLIEDAVAPLRIVLTGGQLLTIPSPQPFRSALNMDYGAALTFSSASAGTTPARWLKKRPRYPFGTRPLLSALPFEPLLLMASNEPCFAGAGSEKPARSETTLRRLSGSELHCPFLSPFLQLLKVLVERIPYRQHGWSERHDEQCGEDEKNERKH